jgi:hypothetical protein
MRLHSLLISQGFLFFAAMWRGYSIWGETGLACLVQAAIQRASVLAVGMALDLRRRRAFLRENKVLRKAVQLVRSPKAT